MPSQIGQQEVAPAGVVPEPVERRSHVEPRPLGHHPLRLLDDDSAVERGRELVVDGVSLLDGAMLQDADGRNIGERLSSDEVLIAEVAEVGSEQIERSDRATSEPHR